LEPLHAPLENARAQRALFFLLSDERHWKAIHKIKRGKKSNHALHNLGAERMKWLEDFYNNEIKERGVCQP
ncbi:unnamed protein product, partial [marine sediment metagenome]